MDRSKHFLDPSSDVAQEGLGTLGLSSQHSAQFIAHLSEGAVIVNEDEKIIAINQAALSMLGWQLEQVVSAPVEKILRRSCHVEPAYRPISWPVHIAMRTLRFSLSLYALRSRASSMMAVFPERLSTTPGLKGGVST